MAALLQANWGLRACPYSLPCNRCYSTSAVVPWLGTTPRGREAISQLEDVFRYVDQRREEPLARLVAYASQPSVSATGDNKGQHLAQILGMEALRACDGELPCNVKVLLDGEEEVGSPNLPAFVEGHRDLLAADLAIWTSRRSEGSTSGWWRGRPSPSTACTAATAVREARRSCPTRRSPSATCAWCPTSAPTTSSPSSGPTFGGTHQRWSWSPAARWSPRGRRSTRRSPSRSAVPWPRRSARSPCWSRRSAAACPSRSSRGCSACPPSACHSPTSTRPTTRPTRTSRSSASSRASRRPPRSSPTWARCPRQSVTSSAVGEACRNPPDRSATRLTQQLGRPLGHHVVDEHAGSGFAAGQVFQLGGRAPRREHLEAEMG